MFVEAHRLAPDARTTLATAGLSISNASPAEAQNELDGTPEAERDEIGLADVERLLEG